jgi:hypothetical protein
VLYEKLHHLVARHIAIGKCEHSHSGCSHCFSFDISSPNSFVFGYYHPAFISDDSYLRFVIRVVIEMLGVQFDAQPGSA